VINKSVKRILTPSLQVKEQAVVQKIRELPVKGNIIVKNGDKVSPDTIVAQAEMLGELHLIRLPEAMGLDVSEILKNIRPNQGDNISKGEIICEHSGLFGLFRSKYASPIDGTVEFIAKETGHIGIREKSRLINLNSFVSGEVVLVEPEKSVTIESHCSYIQGIFGIGGEKVGKLLSVEAANNSILTDSMIPQNSSGSILFGGAGVTIEALRKAELFRVKGIIVGAIDDDVLKAYLGYDLGLALTGNENVALTVIITEGFGKLTMSEKVLDLLKKCNGKIASINGATQVRAGAIRPEIIIASEDIPRERVLDIEGSGLEIGARIRLIRFPYFGQRAVITELPAASVKINTGAYVRVLKAKLDSGEEVVVPRANVEI
jgi:hypothetical protein